MRSILLAALVATPVLAAPCTELPVLFFVQDKSGSMDKAPDGTASTAANPSKWSIAQQVVPSLATQFASRFRFGVEMFPGATTTFNCSAGTLMSSVSSNPAGVQTAYASAIAGGGTPTAVSLQAARSTLMSLGLGAPTYVLLITDGLPNCNPALDPNACTATTPGCANNSCSLGAKDCLDDTAAIQAARALLQAGIKVYVVGFDAALTLGNNKAVLDAMASAGGTGSAYVATNRAQLAATLNTIAQSTATCCRDACTAGTTTCTAGGQVQTCQLDTSVGCTTWTTQTCPPQSACTSGQCITCSNQCTAGATRCNASGNAEQCTVSASGCTTWTTVHTCGYGELCNSGTCNSCQGCAIGASRCTASGAESCEWNVLTGCTQWKPKPCTSGTTCQNGTCTSCNATCTAGTSRCQGKAVETCVADASGCTRWQPSTTCATFCSGGACGTCGTQCTPGQTRCNGSGVETCLIDANTCPAWGPAQHCGANQLCQGGLCAECGTVCTQGTRRCTASGTVEECQLAASGCSTWTTVTQCNLTAGEHCDQGVCIPPCHDACSEGQRQCSVSGRPQACQRAPTGCTLWRDEPVCGAQQQCLNGACRDQCTSDEFESCPAQQVCTGLPGGRLCLPADGGLDLGPADAGRGPGSDAGVTSRSDGGTSGDPDGGLKSIGAQAAGCGCGALEGSLAWLAVLVVAVTRRRRLAVDDP